MVEIEKVVFRRDTTFGRKPRTASELLRQATALLEEEGKWCTSSLFVDGDADDAFENGSICGSWSVCAMGALGAVSGSMPIIAVKEIPDWATELNNPDEGQPDDYAQFYWKDDEYLYEALKKDPIIVEATRFLNTAINEYKVKNSGYETEDFTDTAEMDRDELQSNVIDFNDTGGSLNRNRVIEVFKRACELARYPKRS